MAAPHTEAVVVSLPHCDLCQMEGIHTEARYDGKTVHGPWGFMCERHFRSHGCGLGLGHGQRLVTPDEVAADASSPTNQEIVNKLLRDLTFGSDAA